MQKGARVSHRTEIVTVATPRGPVQVVRQNVAGLRQGSSARPFWAARRKGQRDWREATTAREAIRQALLVAAGKTPAWLMQVAEEAERLALAPDVGDAEPSS